MVRRSGRISWPLCLCVAVGAGDEEIDEGVDDESARSRARRGHPEVFRDGTGVALTDTEFRLLACLMRHDSQQTVTASSPAPLGELPGGSTTGSKGQVVELTAAGRQKVVARGFQRITGLDFGPDGVMYVTELGDNHGGKGDVVRVAGNGARTRIGVGLLHYPSGGTIGPDGRLYVSEWSVYPGASGDGVGERSSPFLRIPPGRHASAPVVRLRRRGDGT